VPEGLNHVKASIMTVRGVVSSAWKRDGDSLTLTVSLPVNSEGTVSVPKIGLENVTITENGKSVWVQNAFVHGVSGITGAGQSIDYVTFDVGSGSYHFNVSR
jgi:alpha-L-rhamnosidase